MKRRPRSNGDPVPQRQGFPQHLLILTGYLWGGGAEWHLLNLVCTLRSMGTAVDVAYLLPGTADAETPWRRQRIEPIRLRNWRSILGLADRGYDLIHAHLFKGEVAGALVSTLLRVPLVISRHSLDWQNLPPWERAVLAHVVQRRACGIIAISEAVAGVCHTALAGRPVPVQVIPYGIDSDLLKTKLRGTDIRRQFNLEDRKLIGTAARLSPDKGLPALLTAYKQVQPALPDWDLVIAGDGPQRDLLHDMARRLNIADRVHFLGWREDVLDMITALDIFAFPSIREGFGLALLEAMTFGIAAVVSDLPSIRETAGDAAVYVPPGNAEALATALRQLADEPFLRSDLAFRSKTQARKFSAESMARQTLQFYAESYAREPVRYSDSV